MEKSFYKMHRYIQYYKENISMKIRKFFGKLPGKYRRFGKLTSIDGHFPRMIS
jgi:hypothetical protein